MWRELGSPSSKAGVSQNLRPKASLRELILDPVQGNIWNLDPVCIYLPLSAFVTAPLSLR